MAQTSSIAEYDHNMRGKAQKLLLLNKLLDDGEWGDVITKSPQFNADVANMDGFASDILNPSVNGDKLKWPQWLGMTSDEMIEAEALAPKEGDDYEPFFTMHRVGEKNPSFEKSGFESKGQEYIFASVKPDSLTDSDMQDIVKIGKATVYNLLRERVFPDDEGKLEMPASFLGNPEVTADDPANDQYIADIVLKSTKVFMVKESNTQMVVAFALQYPFADKDVHFGSRENIRDAMQRAGIQQAVILNAMASVERLRGAGIGRQLFDYFQSTNHKKLILVQSVAQLSTIKFWRSVGFHMGSIGSDVNYVDKFINLVTHAQRLYANGLMEVTLAEGEKTDSDGPFRAVNHKSSDELGRTPEDLKFVKNNVLKAESDAELDDVKSQREEKLVLLVRPANPETPRVNTAQSVGSPSNVPAVIPETPATARPAVNRIQPADDGSDALFDDSVVMDDDDETEFDADEETDDGSDGEDMIVDEEEDEIVDEEEDDVDEIVNYDYEDDDEPGLNNGPERAFPIKRARQIVRAFDRTYNTIFMRLPSSRFKKWAKTFNVPDDISDPQSYADEYDLENVRVHALFLMPPLYAGIFIFYPFARGLDENGTDTIVMDTPVISTEARVLENFEGDEEKLREFLLLLQHYMHLRLMIHFNKFLTNATRMNNGRTVPLTEMMDDNLVDFKLTDTSLRQVVDKLMDDMEFGDKFEEACIHNGLNVCTVSGDSNPEVRRQVRKRKQVVDTGTSPIFNRRPNAERLNMSTEKPAGRRNTI